MPRKASKNQKNDNPSPPAAVEEAPVAAPDAPEAQASRNIKSRCLMFMVIQISPNRV